jgi:hypothetical protein
MINQFDFEMKVCCHEFDVILHENKLRQISSFNAFPALDIHIDDSQVTNFSICIIIHDPSKSGKSTIARVISDHFDGLPIIDIKTICTNFEEKTSNQYIQSFSHYISGKIFGNGFIVDSLDIFPKPNEMDQFFETYS